MTSTSAGVRRDPENADLFARNGHSELTALRICAIRGSTESHSSRVGFVHDEARGLRCIQAQCQLGNLFHRPWIDQKNKASVAPYMRVPCQGFRVTLQDVLEVDGALKELVVLLHVDE